MYMLIDQKSRQTRRITPEPGAVAYPEKRVDLDLFPDTNFHGMYMHFRCGASLSGLLRNGPGGPQIHVGEEQTNRKMIT